jgi:hypothetical protein
MNRRKRVDTSPIEDLFSAAGSTDVVRLRLGGMTWPAQGRFPVNHSSSKVADFIERDLHHGRAALVVAGFAAVGEVVEIVAKRTARNGRTRVLLGTEPFATTRVNFGSPAAAFTQQVRDYWTEQRGVSLRLSAKIVQAIEAVEAGTLEVRFVPGDTRLHAKIYASDEAATVGSSNFTDNGLRAQFEANARFTREADPERFAETVQIANNYWSVGEDWSSQFVDLLNRLLQFVPWQEALAKACAELLEGQWAQRYLPGSAARAHLWPSQIAGIAEALWVVENVGSVLVADATGSGKTRMGAHLTRAVRDRLWATGRVHSDLSVLVCPPAVQDQWRREALNCGLSLSTVSHGRLSRAGANGDHVDGAEVAQAQILAIDEAHNFLTASSNRTQRVRENVADHVLLFTATPINRGAEDLLSLIDLLGADNFDDDTLDVLDQLSRPGQQALLTSEQREMIRREIQRFTVRRTKTVLNDLVDRDPDSYRNRSTGRVNRYPLQSAQPYPTGETSDDDLVAKKIRAVSAELLGIRQLGTQLAVPATLRREFTDERWLNMRLSSAKGLAQHHVLSAMRSSKAALLEHLVGTERAVEQLGLGQPKATSTGNAIARMRTLAAAGPPTIHLQCEVPTWIVDADAWRQVCDDETSRYEAILQLVDKLSTAREQAKADLVARLSADHARIIAFDRHPITLAAIKPLIDVDAVPVLLATGSHVEGRKKVRKALAAESAEPVIALCSDAMNEGLNLQGADVVVHLDLPTTLRVAEQRVGRVDRMDSPYDEIHSWWPNDSASFATRANELLAERNAESAAFLGSNLIVPDEVQHRDRPIDVIELAEQALSPRDEIWDGIRDALEPVRQLVYGDLALLPLPVYTEVKGREGRVMARVSPVTSAQPWAFFAIRGHKHGAPRWLLLEGTSATSVTDLADIAERLRQHLKPDPPSRAFDSVCETFLSRFLDAATSAERDLLPRRLQRALDQMLRFTGSWSNKAARADDIDTAARWTRIQQLTQPRITEQPVDLHELAESWLELVQPLRAQARAGRRRPARYTLLKDIEPLLRAYPLDLPAVEKRLGTLSVVDPIDERVSACILGVPEEARTQSSRKATKHG